MTPKSKRKLVVLPTALKLISKTKKIYLVEGSFNEEVQAHKY